MFAKSNFKMFVLLGVFNVILQISAMPEYHFHNHDHSYGHHHHDFHNHDSTGEDTLVLSHVLFRHGDRTPDSFQELYPNDPYLNETYYPYGLGQLTNAGRVKEYNIGVSLRTRYSSFLSDVFLTGEVEATTTDYNRTKASLLLVLAGLYPPPPEQTWDQQLPWQPIPYNYVSRSQDTLMMGVTCPNYLTLYEQYSNTLPMRNLFKKYRKVFSYISQHSGLNVTRFQDVYNLYFGLSTEQENNLELPAWTKKVWPQQIIDIASREYRVSMGTDDLKRIAAGYLLKKIIDDTTKKINGIEDSKKIYLYSAHENNVAELLIILDVFERHIPKYGAHVMVEVHKIEGVYGFKIFYQNYDFDEPVLLKIPSCEEFCPFEEFLRLFTKYLPRNDLCGN
ncbi:venom acid phosphatase Acph-1-like [Sitophilus oryzae]|uniref:acid phosphatase n=1 Tax=Sitophilus oryzae TaxID=7048 RepID=A0A6J2YJQ7_SITOR|nr:venom acid phosphatase Acph-1-like [Sitophilus oryzae]